VDYRDVLATVVGASVAGIIAFSVRVVFPINAAVLALIYAATYSLLWTIVGDQARLLFQKHLPARTRFDGHWRAVTGSVALVAALGAGLIVAIALSRPSLGDAKTTPGQTTRRVTQTVALQPRVVVTKKTIVLPVETRVVTTPVTTPSGGTSTIFSRTVVVQRPAITVTVSSTRQRTATVTQTTPTVTTPATTAVVTTTLAPTTVAPTTTPQLGTDSVPATTPTDTTPAQ
jgi:hypothetical protein